MLNSDILIDNNYLSTHLSKNIVSSYFFNEKYIHKNNFQYLLNIPRNVFLLHIIDIIP